MCDCSKKNHTRQEVYTFIKSEKLNISTAKGYGLFLVPAPEKGAFETRKIAVDDLTLKETAIRGKHCIAFEWIPQGIEVPEIGSRQKFTVTSIDHVKRMTLDDWDCDNYPCPAGTMCPAFGCYCSTGDMCV